nr:MAG TPA: hypothetical protein [Caudoviricetes sp.]
MVRNPYKTSRIDSWTQSNGLSHSAESEGYGTQYLVK